MRARAVFLAGAVVFVAASGAGSGSLRQARADDAKAASAAVTGSQCTIKGTQPVAKDAQLFDARSGGKAIAKFTGAFSDLVMSDFAADPTTYRARVATSKGSGSLRIDGFASPSAFSFYTTKDIPVAGTHVWISSAQKVTVTAAAANQLTVELKIAGSASQSVKGSAACDSFALTKGTPTGMTTPSSGRGFQTKGASTEIFDDANGTSIFTLKMSEGTGVLFWSTESKAGFVHVLSRGDITIDGWVRQRDLDPLKKGEMMDQLAPATTVVTGAALTLDKPPPIAKATRDIALRSKRDMKDPIVGAIEKDAEVYLMETVGTWVNVLPKGLGLTPADDMGFWVPASEAPRAGP